MKKIQIVKKTTLALVCCLLVASVTPTAGFSHPYHGGGGWGWGLAGLIVGTAVVASMASQPTVVYAAPPAPVYVAPSYGYAAPAVPPGSCRWERYVLDGYGRQVLDQYGRPVKEYTVGPCQYPPR